MKLPILAFVILTFSLFTDRASGAEGQAAPDAMRHYMKGLDMLGKKDAGQAIVEFDKAIAANSEFAEAYCYRGQAWFEKGNEAKSMEDFKQSIASKPSLPMPYYIRGVIRLHSNKDYDNAIADLTKAIELNPDFAEAYCYRGEAWNEKGEFAKAQSDFNTAIKLNPSLAIVYYIRGVIALYKDKDFDKAITDLNLAIEKNYGYAEAYCYRAHAWHEKGNHEKAQADFKRSIELNPSLPVAFYLRGLVAASDGKHAEAITDFSKAIELNPKYIEAFEQRAAAFQASGNTAKAEADKKSATALKN